MGRTGQAIIGIIQSEEAGEFQDNAAGEVLAKGRFTPQEFLAVYGSGAAKGIFSMGWEFQHPIIPKGASKL